MARDERGAHLHFIGQKMADSSARCIKGCWLLLLALSLVSCTARRETFNDKLGSTTPIARTVKWPSFVVGAWRNLAKSDHIVLFLDGGDGVRLERERQILRFRWSAPSRTRLLVTVPSSEGEFEEIVPVKWSDDGKTLTVVSDGSFFFSGGKTFGRQSADLRRPGEITSREDFVGHRSYAPHEPLPPETLAPPRERALTK